MAGLEGGADPGTLRGVVADDEGAGDFGSGRNDVPRRFVLCTTPAQGHTAPLLALARRLVDEGHDVVFFTTAHYRDKVAATGASFVPFDPAYDAHDLMVANPERESSSKRGVRGVKDDLRRIFIGPVPGQYRDLCTILEEKPADAVVVDSMFLGALPLAFGPREDRPALACVGVMPYAASSRDTAPFGVAFQPGTGALARVRNRTLNWCTVHGALADIQRFARHRLAEAGVGGGGRFPGYLIDLPPKVVDAYLQATVPGFEYPRSDLAPSVRFVGPILSPPTSEFEEPPWWGELGAGRPVVHVTQGTLDNADLDRLLLLTTRALAGDDVLVVATTGGPDPEPLRDGLPANARLERFIPHDRLLPHVDVMVTNGGYGGVQQSLANGVPLVVAGDSEDKPEVAARVQWSGTGVNLRTGRPSPAMVAHGVRRVLERRSYHVRARALQQQIAASDPLREISATLAELCARRDAAGRAAGA
jgi:UDP:flavonoid glycosyltransferase YjiC (YdhE family)